jgi:hypothetical protein
MITANVLMRVLNIKVGDGSATAFTIEVDGRQYIVTARHVVKALVGKATVEFQRDRKWIQVPVTVVGHGEGEVDVSVLAADLKLTQAFELQPTHEGVVYGQQMYFLGFPYGWYADIGAVNNGMPVPFVKQAVLSLFYRDENNAFRLFLDGHNNYGFSGGPVVFKPAEQGDFRVAGVISGFRAAPEPVFNGESKTGMTYQHNTGIVLAYGIGHAVDLIKANPIGFAI